ncbi:MAG: hypothetical protein LBN23_01420 [Paludibacter sp.]|nr:hypothetical protein [Paludibacter sp.]
MKHKKFYTHSIIVLLISVAALFNACDSGIDISKASTDELLLPSNLAAPVATLHVKVADFLHYFNSQDLFSIDTTGNSLVILFDTASEFFFRQSSFNIDNIAPLSVPIPHLSVDVPFVILSDVFNIDINLAEDIEFVETIDSIIIDHLELNFAYSPANDIPNFRVGLLLGNGNFYYVDNNGYKTADVEPKYIYTNGQEQKLVYDNILIKPTVAADNTHSLPIQIIFEITGETEIPENTYTVTYSFTNIQPRVAYGTYPAATLFAQHDTLELGDLSFLKGFNFYNPQMSFDVESNFGAYFKIRIDSLYAFNTETPDEKVYLTFAGDSKTDDIDFTKRPLRPYETAYFPNIRTYNRENGKVHLLFQNQNRLMPDRLDYAYSIHAYKMANEPYPESPYFLIPEARAKVNIHVKIPLHFSEGSEMIYADSILLGNLSSLPEIDKINEALLRLTIRNGLPVKATFRIKDFIDSLGNVLPNTFAAEDIAFNIPTPALNANGTVNASVQIAPYVHNLHLNNASYETLRHTRHIAIEVIVNQEDGKQINFQPSNSFEVKAGIYIDFDGLINKDLNLNLK